MIRDETWGGMNLIKYFIIFNEFYSLLKITEMFLFPKNVLKCTLLCLPIYDFNQSCFCLQFKLSTLVKFFPTNYFQNNVRKLDLFFSGWDNFKNMMKLMKNIPWNFGIFLVTMIRYQETPINVINAEKVHENGCKIRTLLKSSCTFLTSFISFSSSSWWCCYWLFLASALLSVCIKTTLGNDAGPELVRSSREKSVLKTQVHKIISSSSAVSSTDIRSGACNEVI